LTRKKKKEKNIYFVKFILFYIIASFFK
jgi:hypothetical protein